MSSEDMREGRMESEFIDGDPIAPIRIEHRCEEIHASGQLEHVYNYLLYTFALGDIRITAKAYLDTSDTVVVFPERRTLGGEQTSAPEFRRDVMSYLARRYDTIEMAGAGRDKRF